MFSFDVVKGDVEALGDLYIELLSHVAHQELDQVGHRQDVGTSRKLNSNGVVILERQNLHVFYLRINLHLSQSFIIIQTVVETAFVSGTYLHYHL